MKVHIYRGGETLHDLDLDAGDYLIGSGDSADVRLPGDTVAAEHVRLSIGSGGVEAEDLGSGWGTFVGGFALTGRRALPEGSILQCGDVGLHIGVGDSAESAARPAEESRYVIGEVVAEGAMGVIRRARELSTGRDVAMKQMRDGALRGSAAVAARFVQEAKITAHLEHPNVVPVHDVADGAVGARFYTMKLVRGISLEKVLELLTERTATALGKYSLEALLTVFQKVCDAVAFAHSKGIIHRDLKPANLMVGEYGEVLVMDWGLAKLVGESAEDFPGDDPLRFSAPGSSSSGTLAGTIMGTPFYMAPEQASGDLELVDERSDIYALGAILYELLTLRTSVEGRSSKEVLQKVRDGKITPIHQRAGSLPLPHLPGGKIPASLAAVAMKALSYSPERRYSRVTDLQAEIRAFQSGFATGAESAGAWRQLTLLVKRHKAVSTAIAASLALVGALTAIYTTAVTRARDNARTALAQVSLEKQRAEEALANLRATAPTLVNEGRRLIDRQSFSEALAKLELAASLDPSNADYHLLRAHLLQAMERLKEAGDAYREVARLRPTQSVTDNLAFCEKLLRENADGPQLSQASREELLQMMLKEGRAILAVPLSGQISQPAALIAQLKAHWNQGQELDAVNDFRALTKLSIDSAIRTEALLAFGEARWKAIWFPSRASPLQAPREWRACAELPEAVATEVAALNFEFPPEGPRGLKLHPDLNQRGPGPKEFGMIANAQRVFPAGKWRFTVRSDDGGRLYVNGSLLIDNWRYSSATEKFADFVQPATGPVDLRVEFCQKDMAAVLQLFVEPVTD